MCEGNYFELFQLMKKFYTAYRMEIPKLFKLLVFNYFFSNGNTHLKKLRHSRNTLWRLLAVKNTIL